MEEGREETTSLKAVRLFSVGTLRPSELLARGVLPTFQAFQLGCFLRWALVV